MKVCNKMPKEGAVVINVTPEGALVRVKKSDACCNCPSSKLCYMGDSGQRDILVRNPIGAKEGQRVEIEIKDGLFVKASFIIYILPIFGLIFGGIIGRWAITILRMNIRQDIGAVIGGLSCMIIVFILISLISRRESYMKTYRPVITKII